MVDPRALAASVLLAGAGLVAWRRAMRRTSLITGTATSRIATAAKGYVELAGVARPISGERLRDPVTHRPCLWFDVVTEQRHWTSPTKWRVVKRASSVRPLVLEDSSGSCAIDVAHADVDLVGPRETVRQSWSVRHTLRRIVDGMPLYALGHLERIVAGATDARAGDVAAALEVQARTAALLREWKKNPARLAARFDADGDGRVDLAEWERARGEAQRSVVDALRPQSQAHGGAVFSVGPGLPPIVADPSVTHRLSRPADGRPLLLSTTREPELARNQRWTAHGGLVVFVIFALAIIGQLTRCSGS